MRPPLLLLGCRNGDVVAAPGGESCANVRAPCRGQTQTAQEDPYDAARRFFAPSAQSVRRVVAVSAVSGWKIYSELEVFDENQKADVIKFFKDIGLPHTTALGSPDYPYGASSKLPYQRTIAYLVCAWERWTAPHSFACTDAQITKVDTAAHQHLMRHLSSKRSAPHQGYTSKGMRSASACTSARRL